MPCPISISRVQLSLLITMTLPQNKPLLFASGNRTPRTISGEVKWKTSTTERGEPVPHLILHGWLNNVGHRETLPSNGQDVFESQLNTQGNVLWTHGLLWSRCLSPYVCLSDHCMLVGGVAASGMARPGKDRSELSCVQYKVNTNRHKRA